MTFKELPIGAKFRWLMKWNSGSKGNVHSWPAEKIDSETARNLTGNLVPISPDMEVEQCAEK